MIVGIKYGDDFVLHTIDGVDTWNERNVESNLGGTLLDVFFANDTTVFAIGREGCVIRSGDACFSWK